MLVIGLTSFIVGALLGSRYKVAVLVLAMAVGLPLILVMNILGGMGAWALILSEVLASTSLQVGYLCAIAARTMLASYHPSLSRRPEMG